MSNRKPYPSDVSDEEWAFVTPYLALVREDAPQRMHDPRALLRLASGRQPGPTAAILDSRTLRSTPESGLRAGYDGAKKRKKGSKVYAAVVDTLGLLLALHVTPTNEQDRAQLGELMEAVQEATGESVELAYVDRGYSGEAPLAGAGAHGVQLEVVKRPEAPHEFMLLPPRWVVERDFAWPVRFRHLANDYERLPAAVTGLHFVAFACLFLHRAIAVLGADPWHALARVGGEYRHLQRIAARLNRSAMGTPVLTRRSPSR